MRIVLLNGGLGNQMFQYTFYKWLEIKTNDICMMDDSEFWVAQKRHNGYELEKVFGLKPKRLSQYFPKDVWDQLIDNRKAGIGIPQQLNQMGFNLFMFAETADFSFHGNVVMMPPNKQDASTKYSVQNVNGNVYYHGYWITNDWFTDIYPKIKKDFCFSPITDEANRQYLSKIRNTASCGIHIRRGDFVELKWALGPEYYLNAIKRMDGALGENGSYFIFSDDLDWCREKEDALGITLVKDRVVYVEGNDNRMSNYVDMQLMTECKWMIMSNSAFNYMAVLLNENLKGTVNPTGRGIKSHP